MSIEHMVNRKAKELAHAAAVEAGKNWGNAGIIYAILALVVEVDELLTILDELVDRPSSEPATQEPVAPGGDFV